MELKTIPISDIKPYKNNPRKNDKAVDAVTESIKQCTYVAPIVVDENNVILAGHTRWKAMKRLGRTECECVVKDGLTEDQKKKYRLLDNKTNELADWDFDLLAEEIEGLDFDGFDFDWEIENDEDYSMLPEPENMHTRPYEHKHFLLTIDYDDQFLAKKIENFCEQNGIEYVSKEN